MPEGSAEQVRKISRQLCVFIALVVFIADQASKLLVKKSVRRDAVIPVVRGFFNLTRTENPGVAFSLFSTSPSPLKTFVLIALSAALLAAVLVILWRARALRWSTGMGLSLILGGAASNLADRIRYGKVLDFLDFYFRGYHGPTFNLADSAIVVGAGLLILDVLLSGS
jgi:signal peptidase II